MSVCAAIIFGVVSLPLSLPPGSALAERPVVEVTPDAKYSTAEQVGVTVLCETDGPAPHQPPSFNTADVRSAEMGLEPRGGEEGFTGFLSTGWTPPDPELAAGPNHVVIIANGGIAFFQHDGTLDFTTSINGAAGFWGGLGATNFVFDPEATFDPTSGRFFVMACERTNSAGFGDSFFLLAVSDDDDPNGAWFKYRLDVTALGGGGDIDSPNLAVDGQAVYLTADFFTGGTKYLIYMLNKANVLVGGAATATSLLVTGTQSFGIARTLGVAPAMYMIENRSPATKVRLHAIDSPLASPTRVTFDLTVPLYSNSPEDPPQAGGGTRPETFGARFWSCEWRNGSLWAVHHQNATRVLARWYEIHTNGWPDSGDTPTLAQSGTIDPGPDIRTFFPAIASDDCGNAAVVFARSSPSEFISMWAAARHADDAPGTMRAPVLIKATTVHYTVDRWGDYGGIEGDPVVGERLWMHHEFTLSGSNWRTWVEPFVARPKGDLTGDDAVTLDDVDPFIALLLGVDQDPYHACMADMNRDGKMNALDVGPLVQELAL